MDSENNNTISFFVSSVISPDFPRHTHEIDDLKLKLELTLQELARMKKSAENLTNDKAGLEESVSRLEKLLHENAEVKVRSGEVMLLRLMSFRTWKVPKRERIPSHL